MKAPFLFIDQYGEREYACTVKELLRKCYRTKASKMYTDTKDGTMHVGYVVGGRWFMKYAIVAKKA